MDRNRWRNLGQVLRGPCDGPAFSSLVFAMNTLQFPGRVGRQQTNLFLLIKCDLKDRNIFLNNLIYLSYLRNLASHKVLWKRLQLKKIYLCNSVVKGVMQRALMSVFEKIAK